VIAEHFGLIETCLKTLSLSTSRVKRRSTKRGWCKETPIVWIWFLNLILQLEKLKVLSLPDLFFSFLLLYVQQVGVLVQPGGFEILWRHDGETRILYTEGYLYVDISYSV
jgi:hypothetical protein